MALELGSVDVGVVLDAFLAFYIILGSIGIGYFFLRTGFKKSDSIHKEYRIGWSIVFGLSYASVVIVFSLGAGFFGIGGMGFSEFIFIFAGLVFAAGVALLKVRSVVLPQPKIAAKQVQPERKEKQEKKELGQVIEFDKPKEPPVEIIEARKAGEKEIQKENSIFGVKRSAEKSAATQAPPAVVSRKTEPKFPSAQKPSATMLEFLELSKSAPEKKAVRQAPPKQEAEKPAAPAEEKKILQAKEPQTPGKFAWQEGEKTVEKKEPFHQFGIFKKDLQKPAENMAKAPVFPAKPEEKPAQQPPVQKNPVQQKLLPAPKPGLKSIIPQKPKAVEQKPQIMEPKQEKQAPVFPQRHATAGQKPVESPVQIKPLEEKKDFTPLPEGKMDYSGLREKDETCKEKTIAEEIPPENETPLQRLLREKREKIMSLKKEKGGNQNG